MAGRGGKRSTSFKKGQSGNPRGSSRKRQECAEKPEAQEAAPQQAIGRPPAYRPEFAAQAEKLCKLGATDAEMADFFEVNVRTISRWQVEHPAFCQALKAGKEEADNRVERSLFQRAVGYKHDAVKIFLPAKSTAPVIVPYVEAVPPDTTACIFWLKNRRPELWRDKREVDHNMKGLENLTYEQRRALGGAIDLLTGDAAADPAADTGTRH